MRLHEHTLLLKPWIVQTRLYFVFFILLLFWVSTANIAVRVTAINYHNGYLISNFYHLHTLPIMSCANNLKF